MTQEMLIDLANIRYHAETRAWFAFEDQCKKAGISAGTYTAFTSGFKAANELREYDAWLSQQDPRSPEEIDAEMDATLAELYA